jgi:hypothetical protein
MKACNVHKPCTSLQKLGFHSPSSGSPSACDYLDMKALAIRALEIISVGAIHVNVWAMRARRKLL